MRYYYAEVKGGVVVNTLDTYAEVVALGMVQVSESQFAALHLGDGYTGGAFTSPPAPPPDPRLWWVDKGPFFDRFGMKGLAILASNQSGCRAVVGSASVRVYIDLQDPRVAQQLDLLIAQGQPVQDPALPGSGPLTAADKAAIINTPTTEAERHIKGLPA